MSSWSPIASYSYTPGIESLDTLDAFSIMSHEIIASPPELLCLLINNPIITPKTDNNIADLNEAPEKHISGNHGGILSGTKWSIGTISFYLESTTAGAAVA